MRYHCKKQFSYFKKDEILLGSLEIKVLDHNVKSVDVVKILGIYFDYGLTFEYHQRYALKRAHKTLNI